MLFVIEDDVDDEINYGYVIFKIIKGRLLLLIFHMKMKRKQNSNTIGNVTFSTNRNYNPFYNYCKSHSIF